jgi:hypothetical protein
MFKAQTTEPTYMREPNPTEPANYRGSYTTASIHVETAIIMKINPSSTVHGSDAQARLLEFDKKLIQIKEEVCTYSHVAAA